MIAPERPKNEAERLTELYKYELLDTVYEKEFDEIVMLASRICQAPMSLITLIDMDRQWYKARYGLDGTETSRNVSFCGHAILNNDLFEVEDTASDERFHDNPFVLGDPYVRYYAGMPLITQAGYKIGTLCVIDRVPRKLDSEQSFAMEVLSKQVVKLFELRIRNKELNKITDVQQEIMTILAHDIRTPLSALKMTIDMKLGGGLSEEDQKEIDELTALQLASTLELVDNVVDWGQLQMSNSNTSTVIFNLHELCDDCFGQIILAANTKDNELINKIDPRITLRGNIHAVKFMLRNIIINANKFTSGGSITVSAEVNKGQLTLSVKDTGVGMSESARNSLMQRTWSATELGTSNEKGSGVGLKLIYEFLQNVNGNIEFISAPGQGTNVIITLPAGK